MTVTELRNIFKSQIRSEMQINEDVEKNLKVLKTHFGRKVKPSDKLLFAITMEKIVGTELHAEMITLIENELVDLSRNYELDNSLTEKRFSDSNAKLKLPIFVNKKIYEQYLKIKGLKGKK